MKRISAAVGVVLVSASSLYADFLVTWGELPSGANTPGTNIVNANQNFSGSPTTYSAITNNPAVGANYYPNNTDRSPLFSAAASVAGSRLVEQAASGDRLTIYANTAAGGTFSGMVMWQSNTMLNTSGSSLTLTNLSIVINQRLNANSANQELRFVVGQGDSFYVSDAYGFGASMTTQSYSIASMTWYDFTPFVSGVATIGSLAPSAPSMTDVQSVGYYFSVQNGGASAANTGAQVQYFGAEGMLAIPEPSTLALFGLVGSILVWRRRCHA